MRAQLGFFERGVAGLRPLVLRDIADDVKMHESTISRVTTHKFVDTPQGLFELKYFFTSSIGCADGDAMSSASVRASIGRLIADEDAKAPLSDQQIAEMLQAQHIDIARRTVAKYREMMKIRPSSQRRRDF